MEERKLINEGFNLFEIFSFTVFFFHLPRPLPETVWYKDGRPLPGTDRVSRGNYGKSLVIKYVTPEDEGDYQCEVSNGVGEAKSHQINLKVLGRG